MRKVQTPIQLDQPLLDWLKAESERRGCSMSHLIRELILREMSRSQSGASE